MTSSPTPQETHGVPVPHRSCGEDVSGRTFCPSGTGRQAGPAGALQHLTVPDGLLASLLSFAVTCFAWPHRPVY